MKRRSASVEEHPKGSGRYRVRARIGGKLKTLASNLTSAQAEEAANAYQEIQHEGEVKQGVTLAAFGRGFLDRRERAGVRAIRTDRASWAKHVERDALGALPVSSLDRRDIHDWLDRRSGIAHRTRLKLRNLLNVALQEAVDRGLLDSNPCREVKVHRSGAATSKDDLEGILQPDEQRRLLEAIPDDTNRALVTFALLTGLRQAEQWWLERDDIQSGAVIVRRSAGGLPPKGGKPRVMPLFPLALAAAELMPRRRVPYIFASLRGHRRQEGKAPRGWSGWLKAAGITRHVRWHDLRHTCATALLAGWWGRKWSIDEVCQMLGHSSTKVTERYARKLDTTLALAVSQTPLSMFPQGNTGGAKLLTSHDQTCSFVKHRSRVQISQSAPLVTGGHWEHTGNSDVEPALALWREALRAQGWGWAAP